MDLSIKECENIDTSSSFKPMSPSTRSLFGFSIAYAFLYRELSGIDRNLWLLMYEKPGMTVLADIIQESIKKNIIVNRGGTREGTLVNGAKIHCKLLSDNVRNDCYQGVLDSKVQDYLEGTIGECVPVMDGDTKVYDSIHEYCMRTDWSLNYDGWSVTSQLRRALDSIEDERLKNYILRMLYSISTMLIENPVDGTCHLRVVMPVGDIKTRVSIGRKPYRKVLILGSALEFDSIFDEDVRRITKPVSRIIAGDTINVVLIYHPRFDLSDVQWMDIQYGILGETTRSNLDSAERQFLDNGKDLYHLEGSEGLNTISRRELRKEILFRSGNMCRAKGSCESHVVR